MTNRTLFYVCLCMRLISCFGLLPCGAMHCQYFVVMGDEHTPTLWQQSRNKKNFHFLVKMCTHTHNTPSCIGTQACLSHHSQVFHWANHTNKKLHSSALTTILSSIIYWNWAPWCLMASAHASCAHTFGFNSQSSYSHKFPEVQFIAWIQHHDVKLSCQLK